MGGVCVVLLTWMSVVCVKTIAPTHSSSTTLSTPSPVDLPLTLHCTSLAQDSPRHSPNTSYQAPPAPQVHLGQLRTNKSEPALSHPNFSPVVSLTQDQHGQALVSGHNDGTLLMLPQGGGSPVQVAVHSCAPYALAWGQHVIAAGSDGKVRRVGCEEVCVWWRACACGSGCVGVGVVVDVRVSACGHGCGCALCIALTMIPLPAHGTLSQTNACMLGSMHHWPTAYTLAAPPPPRPTLSASPTATPHHTGLYVSR